MLRRLRKLAYLASVLLFGAATAAWALTQRSNWAVEWRHAGWTYRVLAGEGEFRLSGSVPVGVVGSPQLAESGALGITYETIRDASGILMDWFLVIPLIYVILLLALIPLFGLVSFVVREGRLRQTRGFIPLDVHSPQPAMPVENDRT